MKVITYKHFADRLEAKRLFIRVGQMDAEGHRLWQALMGWVNEDYPGTWNEWLKHHQAAPESP